MKRLDRTWIRPKDPSLTPFVPPCIWSDTPVPHPTVTEYHRLYTFPSPIRRATLTVTADVSFLLFDHGAPVGQGPMVAGGDIFHDDVLPHGYPTTFVLENLPALDLTVLVVGAFLKQADFSSGASGLSLYGAVELMDGSFLAIRTDESWQVRRASGYRVSPAYNAPYEYDGTLPLPPFGEVEYFSSRWRAADARIPTVVEETVRPLRREEGEDSYTLLYDRIYSAYLDFENTASHPITFRAVTQELPNQEVAVGTLTLAPHERHRALKMYSVGGVRIEGEDCENVKVSLQYTHYPYGEGGEFSTSDEGLNTLYDVAKHTLHICRQSWHLDSPRHQEPLGCMGDYYIETLMAATADGDMRLSHRDLVRTAELLVHNGGDTFHTSYSLIWVNWLESVYQFTGDLSLLSECKAGLCALFDRFATWHGPLGLLEFAPDYMFLDWQTADGYSLHHPPMALGQTALCAFYAAALAAGARLFDAMGEDALAHRAREKREKLERALWEHLYSEQDEAFLSGFAGDRGRKPSRWLPENPDKTYVTLHANVLCVWAGIVKGEEGARLLRRVLSDESLPDYQPYFGHFVLDAARRVGLTSSEIRPIWDRFVKMAQDCPLGLAEGWLTPPTGYGFDHSHAWGGTPVFQMPVTLLGLCIEEAGMKHISLCPDLMGLSYCHVEIPVPDGRLSVELAEGEPPHIRHPEGITVTLRQEKAPCFFRE